MTKSIGVWGQQNAVPLLITHQQGQTGLSIAARAVDLAVDWLVWLC